MRALLLIAGLGLASAAGAADMTMTPGKWQIVNTVESMAMPGMPPELRQGVIPKPMTTTICITPQQATAGPRDVIGKTNGACHYRNFTATAGRISGVMECKGGMPAPLVVAIEGSFSPTGYDIRSKMNGGAMQSTSRTVGKRIGPC